QDLLRRCYPPSPERDLIVVDASAAVDYLLAAGAFERIAARLATPAETLHAPHLLDVEVAHALRRLAISRAISVVRAEEALADLGAMRVRRYPHAWLLPRMWQLRSNMSAFDAAYVALAETLDASLVTADGSSLLRCVCLYYFRVCHSKFFGPLNDPGYIVVFLSQEISDHRILLLIEQQPHRRAASCWRFAAAAPCSNNSSFVRIQSSISPR